MVRAVLNEEFRHTKINNKDDGATEDISEDACSFRQYVWMDI